MEQQNQERRKVQAAFRSLRKQGFTAKMNFLCCSGCALSQLDSDGVKDGDDFAFFHRQDGEAFDGLNLKSNLHIRWGGNGAKVVDALVSEGLVVLWNGDSGQTIQVVKS